MRIPGGDNCGDAVLIDEFVVGGDFGKIEIATTVLDLVLVKRTTVIQPREVFANVLGTVNLRLLASVQKMVFKRGLTRMIPGILREIFARFVNALLAAKDDDTTGG